MAYIGNQQTQGFSSIPAKQDLTGATGTSLTLSHAVASAEGIDLFINNVRQEPTTAYSVGADGVTVTLTGSVVATDDIYVVYNSLALQTTVPPDASVSTAKIIDGAVTAAKINSLPTGSVLQVKQTMLTAKSEINNTSYEDSDLTINITPSSTSSKIMVNVSGYFGIHFFNANPFWRLRRDTTVISGNDSQAWPFIQYDVTRDALSVLPLVMNILDSPSSTSQLTYTLQGKTTNASYPIYLNRGHTNNVAVAQSTITVTEIAG